MNPTRTKVVIINGAPQSGKDTLVELATDYCNMEECANVLNLSSVDLIKDTLRGFGWDGNKTNDVRNIIAGIKKIWVFAQNGPTMYMMNNILQFHMSHVGEDNIVFCHIRESEEIDKLKNAISGMDTMGIDIMTLLVIRKNNYLDVDELSDSDNPRNIARYEYDHIIYNDSDLASYDYKVCEFIDKILEEDK